MLQRLLESAINFSNNQVNYPNYQNVAGCGNLFVFKKGPAQAKSLKLPMQERYKYAPDQNLEIFEDLFLANFVTSEGMDYMAKDKGRKETKKPKQIKPKV